jgi:hypothetical protein
MHIDEKLLKNCKFCNYYEKWQHSGSLELANQINII